MRWRTGGVHTVNTVIGCCRPMRGASLLLAFGDVCGLRAQTQFVDRIPILYYSCSVNGLRVHVEQLLTIYLNWPFFADEYTCLRV